MQVEWRDVITKEGFILIDGKEFELKEVIEILQGLQKTGSFGPFIVINNSDLQDWLEILAVCFVRNQGSCYRTSGYDNFVSNLSSIAYEDDTAINRWFLD